MPQESRVAIIVCGGRGYSDWGNVEYTLDRTREAFGVTDLFHGAASGADALASRWARGRPGIVETAVPAEWAKYGRSAGPIRNEKMLAMAKPRLVVAFPGGRGTADMVRQAAGAGVHVLMVDLHLHRVDLENRQFTGRPENAGHWVVGGNEAPVGPCGDLEALLMGIGE